MVGLVQARGLSFVYPGGVRALEEVDVAVEAGQLLAVLGPNGAGKSTLLKLLGGLLRPGEGQVLLGGERLGALSSRARARRIAVVPQALAALPDVTVRTFAGQGRYAHQGPFSRPSPGDREAVERAMAEADVADLAGRGLGELSGGQRQRALVARALAQEAELLLIDEPTNALDPEHQIAVFELIAGLAQAGRGALVVTHDLNLASQFATRVVLLDGGRKAADGSVEEVLRREVLEPVYGRHLVYTTLEGGDGRRRPVVLPWRESRAARKKHSADS